MFKTCIVGANRACFDRDPHKVFRLRSENAMVAVILAACLVGLLDLSIIVSASPEMMQGVYLGLR
jgi:hypothetical protein